jgi:uncharacterized protein DUF4268
MTQHASGVELYIDRGRGLDAENMRIFHALLEHREQIERDYGGPLDWQPLETKRACRIRQDLKGGYRDEESWPQIHEAMIDAMIRLEKTFRPHIDRLVV